MRTLVLCLLLGITPVTAQVRFTDDFEGDLSGWSLLGAESISIEPSGDESHGGILELRPNEVVYALVRGSGKWGSVRVDADFRFPGDGNSYLGFIYNFSNQGRVDFGNIYLKGNGSYLRVNPRRDGNVSRLLYEEYRTPLKGPDAIQLGKWHRMRAEVVENTCHLYIDDMTTPKLTFDLYERTSGLVGFEPRVVGTPVWLDNVEVTSIDRLSWSGPPIPNIEYAPEELLTDWEVIGPFGKPMREVEKAPEPSGRRVQVKLEPGENVILLRVRNGQFASGGFFARLEHE